MDYQACGDAQLAALVRAGQGEAFAELSARYLGLIRAKAKLFEGASAPEKEDLWQEGLLGLYAAAISYQPGRGASFPTYAGVCVYNQMASAVRRHGSSGNRPLNESVPLEDAGEAAVEAGPEALLELREDHGGNTVIRRHEADLLLLEVPAEELHDVDTAQALEELKAEDQV